MFAFCSMGFGLGRREIEGIIQNFFKVSKKPNPFCTGVPGEGWRSGFMRRHPQLTKRKPQNLQMVLSEANIN